MKISSTPNISETNKRKEIPGLYLLKLLAALVVVDLHTSRWIFPDYAWFGRIFLPIFFVITGYFITNDLGELSEEKIKRALKKVFKIALWAQAAFMIISLLANPQAILTKLQDWHEWINLVIIGDFFQFHLWYLNAYIFLMLALLIAMRIKVEKTLIPIALLGLAAALLLGKYNIYLHWNSPLVKMWSLDCNFVTIGLPFLLTGILIKRNPKLTHLPWSILTVLLICIALAAYYEFNYLNEVHADYYGDIFISTLPFAAIVFLIFMRFSGRWLNTVLIRGLVWLGKNFTLGIYLWHPVILNFLNDDFREEHKNWLWLIALSCALIITLLLKLILRLKNLYFTKSANLLFNNSLTK